jgi:amidase
METTAGSLALLGAEVPRDAFVVRRLRRAGAVILGKANLSEWANFRSTQSSSGWSGRAGQCLSPYVSTTTRAAPAPGRARPPPPTWPRSPRDRDRRVDRLPLLAQRLVGIKPTLG